MNNLPSIFEKGITSGGRVYLEKDGITVRCKNHGRPSETSLKIVRACNPIPVFEYKRNGETFYLI